MLALIKAAALLLAAAALFFAAVVYSAHSLVSLRRDPKPAARVHASGPAIVEQLRTLRELHLGVASIQTVITSAKTSRLLKVPVGSTRMLYVAVGQVRAGIDLAELDEDSVSVTGEETIITLPPPRILDAKLDVEKSYVYDVRQSIAFAPDSVALHSEVEVEALREIVKAAEACGILDLAGEQARQVVEALLSMAGEPCASVVLAPA